MNGKCTSGSRAVQKGGGDFGSIDEPSALQGEATGILSAQRYVVHSSTMKYDFNNLKYGNKNNIYNIGLVLFRYFDY